MTRSLFIGILFLSSALACTGQNLQERDPLIKARYQVSEKFYQEALSTLEKLGQSPSDPMRMLLTRGLALAGLQRYDESNRLLSKVTGAGTAEAAYCMAKNCLALNDLPSAMQSLEKHLGCRNHYPEKKIRMDADFSKLENNRDWIHLWQTDWYTETEQQVAECEYLISQSKPDEAEDLDNRLLAAHPGDAGAWLIQARIAFQQKDMRRMRQAVENAWQFAAGDQPVRDELLHFAMQVAWYDKANAMAGELIRTDPTNPDYLTARALVRILDGKESIAMKEIEDVRECGIAPAELYYQAGKRIASSMPLQAEAYLTRAIDAGRLDARFYYTRGTVRAYLDKVDLALADYAMSLDINPLQPDLYAERAQVRYDKGDTEGACYDWKKALEQGNAKASDLLYKYCRLP